MQGFFGLRGVVWVEGVKIFGISVLTTSCRYYWNTNFLTLIFPYHIDSVYQNILLFKIELLKDFGISM